MERARRRTRREAARCTRSLPDEQFPSAHVVGGWWNRINNPAVDLVAVDDRKKPKRLSFVGEIKWRDRGPFDRADFAELAARATDVPGHDRSTPLVAVSRSGVAVDGLDAV